MRDQVRLIAERLAQGQHRVICPCAADRRHPSHRHERTLSIFIDGRKVAYQCHHCQTTGGISLDFNPNRVSMGSPMAVVHTDRKLVPAHVSWVQTERGISEATLAWAGVYSGRSYIQAAGEETDVIVFPYRLNGHQYAAKLRSYPGKGFACQGSPASFFLVDQIVPKKHLIICEGELDALAFHEAGIENAVSVPSGASPKIKEGKIDPADDYKFRYVWSARKEIDAATRIVLACDNDEPGNVLAEELARRIGKYRCWRISWPKGIKDANEALTKLGKEALNELVAGAVPWPVAGLYDASHYGERVMELYRKGEGRGESVGLTVLDELYTVVPGQLTIVTGVPSSGKSELIDQVVVNLAERLHWKFCLCSFENPPETHIVKILEKHARRTFYDPGGHANRGRMQELDVKTGMRWVGDHFYWVEQADGAASTVDSILERAKAAVMRYGVRGLVIDPYNYIERSRDLSETDFVSEVLTKLKQFAVGHGVHVWFIAHPYKLRRDPQTGRIPMPEGYEISGSASWFAKADCGLTVHREDLALPEAIVRAWKIRFKWVGQPGTVTLKYDRETGRYSDGLSKDRYVEAFDAPEI